MPLALTSLTTNLYEISYQLSIQESDLIPLCDEEYRIMFGAEYEYDSNKHFDDLTIRQWLCLIMLNSLHAIIPTSLSKKCLTEYEDTKDSSIPKYWHKLRIEYENGIPLNIEAIFEPMYGWVTRIDAIKEFKAIYNLIKYESKTLIFHYYDATTLFPEESDQKKSLIKKEDLTEFKVTLIN